MLPSPTPSGRTWSPENPVAPHGEVSYNIDPVSNHMNNLQEIYFFVRKYNCVNFTCPNFLTPHLHFSLLIDLLVAMAQGS